MKTLQNDFTMIEQSERLIEIGVPKWSADDYIDEKGCRHSLDGILDVELFFQNFDEYTPCWSVGRLMEIIDICALGENSDSNTEEYPSTIKVMNKLHITYIEYLIKSMERAAQLGTIDFSKLEE